MIAIGDVRLAPTRALLGAAFGRLRLGVEDGNVRADQRDEAHVGRAICVREEARAAAHAGPPVIRGTEAHAAFRLPLDRRVRLLEEGVTDDVAALAAGLTEDRRADAVLAVLEGHEAADAPADLVADAEPGAGHWTVDGVARPEVDPEVRDERNPLDGLLTREHDHRRGAVVTAEVGARAGRSPDVELGTEKGLLVLAAHDGAADVEAQVGRCNRAGAAGGDVRGLALPRALHVARAIVGIAARLERGPWEGDAEAHALENLEARGPVDRELILDDGRAPRRAREHGRVGRDVPHLQRPQRVADGELPIEDVPGVHHWTEQRDPVVGAAWHLETIEVERPHLRRSLARRRGPCKRERGERGREASDEGPAGLLGFGHSHKNFAAKGSETVPRLDARSLTRPRGFTKERRVNPFRRLSRLTQS